MNTTLNQIKQHSPCSEGWGKLLAFLNKTEADDEELSLLTILESNGLSDAIWALRSVKGKDREIRLMACDFAESTVHLANDECCNNAIAVSRRYANGEATQEELKEARVAARAAARVAASAEASAAAWAAARVAASAEASAAASAEAREAASAAASAEASAAAWAAEWAARAAEQEKQIVIFKKYCN